MFGILLPRMLAELKFRERFDFLVYRYLAKLIQIAKEMLPDDKVLRFKLPAQVLPIH